MITNAQVYGASLRCLDSYMLIYLPVLVTGTCLSVFYAEIDGYLLLGLQIIGLRCLTLVILHDSDVLYVQ